MFILITTTTIMIIISWLRFIYFNHNYFTSTFNFMTKYLQRINIKTIYRLLDVCYREYAFNILINKTLI